MASFRCVAINITFWNTDSLSRATGLAVTVMARGTVPPDLAIYRDLPDLPFTCIQIATRAQGLSAAAEAVKGLVEGLW